MRQSIVGCITVVTVLGACDAPARETGSGMEKVPSDVEILIATEHDLIGLVSDIRVGSDGAVYVVDRQASQIHVVGRSGEYLESLGGPGAGPGEFDQPSGIEIRGDTLAVVDWGNGRLQLLDRAGAYLGSRPLPAGPAPAVVGGPLFARPTWGAETVLAVLHGSDLSVLAGLGRSFGEPTNRIRPREMKREIQEGRVPTIMQNMVELLVAPDSTTLMWVEALGTIQRFGPDGTELWSLQIEELGHGELVAEFQRENAEKPLGSFFPMRYVKDVTQVGAEAWVLLGATSGGPASVRVVTGTGSLGPRLEFPQVTDADEVAVDKEGGWIYFARPEWAELVRVPVRPAG